MHIYLSYCFVYFIFIVAIFYRNRYFSLFSYFIFLVIWGWLLYNRNVTLHENDLDDYLYYFYDFTHFSDLLDRNKTWKGDYVFYVIIIFFRLFSDNYNTFLSFFGLSNILLISFVLFKSTSNSTSFFYRNYIFLMGVFSLLSLHSFHFLLANILRQGLAFSFIFLFIYYYSIRMINKNNLSIFLGVLAHKSSLIFLLIYASNFSKKNIKIVITISLLCAGIYLYNPDILMFFRKINMYSDSSYKMEERKYIYILLGIFTLVIFLCFLYVFKKNMTKLYNIFPVTKFLSFLFIWLSCILLIISFFFPGIYYRFSVYLNVILFLFFVYYSSLNRLYMYTFMIFIFAFGSIIIWNPSVQSMYVLP